MLWQLLVKKTSFAFWYFAQKDSFSSLLFNLNSEGKELRSYQTSSSILNNIFRSDESHGWSYCYLTKATLFTVRMSYTERQYLLTTEYSGGEEELSVWLVTVKKKKMTAEWQNHYSSKGLWRSWLWVQPFAQSKFNAELGPGYSGFFPAGSSFQIMGLIFLSHSSAKSFVSPFLVTSA